MKKTAIIQDLSSFGRCSLTAAMPVLSVMGIQVCPLPTAILTAQTGYSHYFCKDLTEEMTRFTEHWQLQHESFDGIMTGFVANEMQITHIETFLETFQSEQTVVLIDPVLGDDGMMYDMYNSGLLERMKELVRHATIITPNVTEACLLTGISYERLMKYVQKESYLKALQEIGHSLQAQTSADIVVTGATWLETCSIANMILANGEVYVMESVSNGQSYSGTGDLFASVLMGGALRGDSLKQSVELAQQFIAAAIADTICAGSPPIAGVHFERHLKLLL